MIDTIEQLEKEIDTFHKNIASSNELIKQLDTLIDVSKKNREEFSKSVTDVIRKIETSNFDIHNNSKDVLHEMKIAFENYTSDYLRKINDLLRKVDDVPSKVQEKNDIFAREVEDAIEILLNSVEGLPEKFEKAHKKIIDLETEKIRIEVSSHIRELKNYDSTLKSYEAALNQIYNDFVKKLDTADFAKILGNSEETIRLQKRNQLLLMFGFGGIFAFLGIIYFVR
jgi:hypothetical protein